ncbi:MAG: CvpA family protein [Desulfobacterales bacterium]|nr:CvpA family protein [Desulfobacterales bacterium]
MSVFDIVIITVLLYCLIRGFFRGLTKEISSIIGVLAGFYAAYSYYSLVAKPLARWITNIAYLNILSFLLVFIVVFITISILGVIIKYLLNIAYLGWVDRGFGAGFGLIKGILIAAVLFIILTAFLPRGAPVIEKSRFSPHLMVISEKLVKVVSQDMKKEFFLKLEDLKKAWKIHR